MNKLAALLDVPIWLVKESLGIPFEKCTSSSLGSAILALENADRDSDEERAAFIKAEELILESLEKVSSIESLKELYSTAHRFLRGSEAEKKILKKWNEISLKLLEAAGDNISRIIKICRDSPRDSEAKKKAIQVIAKLNFESLSDND